MKRTEPTVLFGSEWVEREGLIFRRAPSLKRRLPGKTPDGKPVYETANDLRTYREVLGVDADWKLESFHNHVHFSHREGEEACLAYQHRDLRDTEAALRDRFPTRRFVIVVAPLDQNTVYQPTEEAPTEDDAEWEPNGPLSALVLREMLRAPGADPATARAEAFAAFRERPCGRCETRWRYETDHEREGFPGIRWADCPNCGLPNAVALRTLRRLVAPG